MEQPAGRADGLDAWNLRGTSDVLAPEDSAPASPRLVPPRPVERETVPTVDSRREWRDALALVEDASAALRHSEDRIGQLEAEAARRLQDTRSALEALQAQLRLAHREIERANEQAAAATARATAAEAWLERLGGTIVSSFGRLQGSS